MRVLFAVWTVALAACQPPIIHRTFYTRTPGGMLQMPDGSVLYVETETQDTSSTTGIRSTVTTDYLVRCTLEPEVSCTRRTAGAAQRSSSTRR